MKTIFSFAMLLLFVTQVHAAEDRNNIVILLDTSSSMQEQMRAVRQSKWDAAKTALIDVVDQIPENTNIGLLLFENWKYDLQPVDKAELTRAIQNAQITPQSGTPLGTYIKEAADRLLKEREKAFGYGTYKLLVVTDGDPTNEPRGLVEKYLPEVLSRGITVECIGVSMANSSILKDKVHKYMSADDPTSLTQQIQSTVLAEVSLEDGVDGGFDFMSGIPDETAQVIITTLSTTGNHPIGEKPPVIVDVTDQSNTTVPQNQQVETSSNGPGIFFVIIAMFVLIVFVLILTSIFQS
jgi:uncharacterized protein YegL